MSQGVLGFKYEEEKHDSGMTGLAGLPIYLDLLHAMGLPELIGRHLQVKQRGLPDAQMVLSLILLNIAGGDCVEDLGKVQKDEGFCRILRRVEQQGMKRLERREIFNYFKISPFGRNDIMCIFRLFTSSSILVCFIFLKMI